MNTDDWKIHGRCATHPNSDLWYPDTGRDSERAQQLCAECPVREQCYQHAITRPERYGIWGGTTETERRRITAQQARNTPNGHPARYTSDAERDHHIHRLHLEGNTVRAIADMLGISPRTVDRARIRARARQETAA